MAVQAKKYEKVNHDKREKIHLLSGILKCPVCGAGMYGNKSIKKRKDGSNYKDFYYYGCKHRNMTRGHKCDYKKQVHEEMLDASVAEVISKLVSNPKFSDLIRNKINMEVDTSALDQEIENYKIQLRKLYHNKDTILSDMDSLDYEDKHYQRRKTDLENHLYKTYDKIDDEEELLVSAKAKKRSLLADKITGDTVIKVIEGTKVTENDMWEFANVLKDLHFFAKGIIYYDDRVSSGAKKVAELTNIDLKKFDLLDEVRKSALSAVKVMLPDEEIIGDPFWTVMETEQDSDKNTGNYEMVNDSILLFLSKKQAINYCSKIKKSAKVFGISQNHLKVLVSLQEKSMFPDFSIAIPEFEQLQENSILCYTIPHKSLKKFYLRGDNNE